MQIIKCDYLVIGAGAAGLAFVDTLLLLNERDNGGEPLSIVLVDEKAVPGGHWVDGYGYVRLHQPSVVYGLESRQLEGNWAKLMFRNRMLPWNHRASKKEILDHFRTFVDDKVKSKQVRYFPNCRYDFSSSSTDGDSDSLHTFSTVDGKTTYRVEVGTKLVNAVLGECIIPSRHPPKFPIEKGIHVLTPNDLYDYTEGGTDISSKNSKKGQASEQQNQDKDEAGGKDFAISKDQHYVVLGCGKTGMDTIIYLRTVMNVEPDRISWVIPNDVWMLIRGGAAPWAIMDALLEFDGDQDKAMQDLEEKECLCRLDKQIQPTKFRFPVVGKDELEVMREIKSTVRRGRVASIKILDGKAVLDFGAGQDRWIAPTEKYEDCVFVHCTTPGPFNGNYGFDLFPDDRTMNLWLLYAPPISQSMSALAYLEFCRRKGVLDIEFGRKILAAYRCAFDDESNSHKDEDDNGSDNAVLRQLFFHMNRQNQARIAGDMNKTMLSDLVMSGYRGALNLALLLAVGNADPLVVLKWLKNNRLSMLSIPGYKAKVYETMLRLSEKGKILGLSEGDIAVTKILAEKLKPLRGM